MARNNKKPAYQIAFDITKEILEEEKRPLNPNQIYDLAIQKGYGDRIAYGGKTPKSSFARDIYINLRFDPNTIFEIVQQKPKLLIKLKNQDIIKNNVTETVVPKCNESKSSFNERNLHPLLVSFLFSSDDFYAFSKTIFHEESRKSKSGTDKWLYPDIVAVNFEYSEFDNEVSQFIGRYDKLPIKIYSFELKKELTVANFRECYFQAVSNSSWANEGYLVAADIDEDLLELIKRSNQSFGIGVIRLNIEEPAQSEILVSAQFKPKLDYIVMNELSAKNPNFQDFLKTIHEYDHKNKGRYEKEFDKVLNEEEMENYKKEKKIK